ncbi:MAG: aminoacetone oxidase family FAD-binding enzyme, partial [Candidatus Omnitrophota bacterium]
MGFRYDRGARAMSVYDIAVIGAGAAGSLAAVRAAQCGAKVALIERNDRIGRKILLTGNGRCNITNSADLETFVDRFAERGPFLRTALYAFFNRELLELFSAKGLEFREEVGGCFFPVTDTASSVISVLMEYLAQFHVDVIYGMRVTGVRQQAGGFLVEGCGCPGIEAHRIILACGGGTYRTTGTTGDGYLIAQKLGHLVIAPRPALVPLVTSDQWVREVQGVSLKEVEASLAGNKKIAGRGDMLFTHFGISGPLALNISGMVVERLAAERTVGLRIDLKPGERVEEVDAELGRIFKIHGAAELKTVMKSILTQRLVPIILNLAGIDAARRASQVANVERRRLAALLKGLPLT